MFSWHPILYACSFFSHTFGITKLNYLSPEYFLYAVSSGACLLPQAVCSFVLFSRVCWSLIVPVYSWGEEPVDYHSLYISLLLPFPWRKGLNACGWAICIGQLQFRVYEWGAVGKIGTALLWDAISTVKSYPFPGRTPNFFWFFNLILGAKCWDADPWIPPFSWWSPQQLFLPYEVSSCRFLSGGWLEKWPLSYCSPLSMLFAMSMIYSPCGFFNSFPTRFSFLSIFIIWLTFYFFNCHFGWILEWSAFSTTYH